MLIYQYQLITQQTNPLYDILLLNDKITYASLDLSFVDENLNNYKEIHDVIILAIILSFKICQTLNSDRFPVQLEIERNE